MFFVVHDRGPLLLPVELQSASPGGHCSSNPPPPTQIVQNRFKRASPLSEGRWDGWSNLDACANNKEAY